MRCMIFHNRLMIIRKSKSLLDTSLESGLSGPSRLHDLFVTFDAMTPGDFKQQGAGLNIDYSFCASPFGECLMAITKRGICHLGFVQKSNKSDALQQLFETWPGAVFSGNPQSIDPLFNQIFNLDKTKEPRPFNLLIKGTNFQINVWIAATLLQKPRLVARVTTVCNSLVLSAANSLAATGEMTTSTALRAKVTISASL